MWYSMCSNCQEQITSESTESEWVHTVWVGIAMPPELRPACPTVPNSVATPTEGMIVEFPAPEEPPVEEPPAE